MKKLIFWVTLTILLATACQNSNELFQANTDDWVITGDANWKFANNELIGTLESGVGFVMTKQTFNNFILEIEFNPDSTINSGVFIRCKNNNISPINCYEINIWDLHPNQDYRTGAIVMKDSPLAIVETINKWNSYKIRCENDHIQVWINGIITTDIYDDVLIEGYIGLQAAGSGVIKFRNITIHYLE